MNATETQSTTSVDETHEGKARWTRVDAAHEPSLAGTNPGPGDPGAVSSRLVESEAWLEVEEPTPEMIAAVAGLDLESRREQLQLQVAQLAEHLRERLREVDRRESTVNARIAQLESDLRTSRLWLREREMAFQDREHELKYQIDELQERLSARASPNGTNEPIPADLQVELESRSAELQEREHQLHLREDELRERRFEFDRQVAALRHSQQLWQQQWEREEKQLLEQQRQSQQELDDQRQQMLEQSRATELLLTQHAQQLDGDRTALQTDRKKWEEQNASQRLAIEELKAAAEGELADRRERLKARQEWTERQKAGLDQVRDEALRLHRQSLEMRLLAEQLWAQITGNLAPSEVTQAIAQLRLKLAEQYKLEEQQLDARRDELAQLSERIARQHGELEQLRKGLREWAVSRDAEIHRQAETLVQRELALDAQQDELRAAAQSWQSERRQFEQQIRDLKTQVRALPVAA